MAVASDAWSVALRSLSHSLNSQGRREVRVGVGGCNNAERIFLEICHIIAIKRLFESTTIGRDYSLANSNGFTDMIL